MCSVQPAVYAHTCCAYRNQLASHMHCVTHAVIVNRTASAAHHHANNTHRAGHWLWSADVLCIKDTFTLPMLHLKPALLGSVCVHGWYHTYIYILYRRLRIYPHVLYVILHKNSCGVRPNKFVYLLFAFLLPWVSVFVCFGCELWLLVEPVPMSRP